MNKKVNKIRFLTSKFAIINTFHRRKYSSHIGNTFLSFFQSISTY